MCVCCWGGGGCWHVVNKRSDAKYVFEPKESTRLHHDQHCKLQHNLRFDDRILIPDK